jgi:hypothetical protein
VWGKGGVDLEMVCEFGDMFGVSFRVERWRIRGDRSFDQRGNGTIENDRLGWECLGEISKGTNI